MLRQAPLNARRSRGRPGALHLQASWPRPADARWVEMRSEAFAWQGRPATLCFLKDVTAQRLIEEKYRRVVNCHLRGVRAARPRTCASPRSTRPCSSLTGYEPEELVGKRIDALVRPRPGGVLLRQPRPHELRGQL
ncbi:MAG: hypothetical protein MZV70_56345 [Desulfobacterales bacterium]|nr:hypothetical protein [Desulfobacterales bacterium]